jgi:uncharacterized membrane protein YkoI
MSVKKYAITTSTLIAGSFLLAANISQAEDNGQKRTAPEISMETVTRQMEEKYDGTVTEVELDREWRGDVYEIEVRGRDSYEYDVEVDANSGEILKEERGREDW